MPNLSENMYRFACPSCHHMLKAPLSWAGRRGACPKCHEELMFPRKTSLFRVEGEGAKTLLKLVSESAQPLPEDQVDRLSLLLSQGTCLDYTLAQRLLAGRSLPPRQWRRLLPIAGTREAMRLQLSDAVEQLESAGQGDAAATEELSVVLPPEDGVDEFALAWEIIVRYQDFVRNGTCVNCQSDPTGLHCVYHSFGDFGELRSLDGEDCRRWAKLCRQIFGLVGTVEAPALEA